MAKSDVRLGHLGSRGLAIEGTGPYMQIGSSVATAGDFNGDGIDDFVISGAYPDPDHGIGVSYIIFGTGAATLPRINLAKLSPTQGFRITGPAGFDGSNLVAASAGDVDGDGYGDIVIGTVRYDKGFDPDIGPTRFTGRGYVVYGHAGPGHAVTLGATTDRVTTIAESHPAYVGQDGPELGLDAKAIGDVNGDGREDFAISAPNDSTSSPHAGRLYVIYGGAALGPSFDLDAMTPAQGFFVSGTAKALYAGVDFAGLSDVNGDGIDDLAVAAGDENGNGAISVLYGHAGGLANTKLGPLDPADGFRIVDSGSTEYRTVRDAGDVNGDGYADVLIKSSQRVFVVLGKAAGVGTVDLNALAPGAGFEVTGLDRSRSFQVAAAGDVNGDGYDDVAVFNYSFFNGFTSVGYVIFGHAGSFGPVDVTKLTATTGFAIRGSQPEDAAGSALSSAGDVNNDGTDDLLIGASQAGNEYSGAAYLVYGQTPEVAVTRTGTEASQRLAGGAFDDVMSGLGGDDILYGNAGADRLDGGDGDDLLNGGAGADRMGGGAGDDLYRVDETGDKAIEAAGAGFDSVEAAIDWTLGKNVEALVLRDGAAIVGKGNELDNVLTGNANANVLNGLAGDDVLIGGAGSDQLTGGSGRDVFRFDGATVARTLADADRVTDFARAEDKLDLSRVDGAAGSAGVDPFIFIGTAAFTGRAGDLRYDFMGKNTVVSGDTDGDGAGDVFVWLKGRIALDADDFAFAGADAAVHAPRAGGGWLTAHAIFHPADPHLMLA